MNACTQCNRNVAAYACPTCGTVYCGSACQARHWPVHLLRCKAPIREDFPVLHWNAIVDTGDTALLARYGAFRKATVDALLEQAVQVARCPQDNVCFTRSVGSTTLTSDYDITVSGPKAANIVDAFNRMFRAKFNAESAEVFDTNVYGASFVEVLPEREIHSLSDATGFFQDAEGKWYRYLPVTTDAERQAQRMWAYIKLSLYYPAFQHHAVWERRALLDRGVDRNNRRQMNERYVQELYRVQALRENPKRDNAKYREAISRANYYGAETYFTQGAFLHIVGKRQSGWEALPISHWEYRDSALENAAKAIHALQEGNWRSTGKYVARVADALNLDELYRVAWTVRNHPENPSPLQKQFGDDPIDFLLNLVLL